MKQNSDVDFQELEELLVAWREGVASEQQLWRLHALLGTSEARKALWEDWFLEQGLPQAFQVATFRDVAEGVTQVRPMEQRAVTGGGRWIPLSAVAGLVCGFLSASMVWAISAPRPVATAVWSRVLVDGGFEGESGAVPKGFPIRMGMWGGDASRVRQLDAPKALEGRQVLEFLKAEDAQTGGVGKFCDVYQVLDLSKLEGALEPQHETTLEFSCAFRDGRTAKEGAEALRFLVSVILFREDPTVFGRDWQKEESRAIGRGVGQYVTSPQAGERDGSGWNRVTARCILVPQARYAVVHVAAGAANEKAEQPVELGEVFADQARLLVKTQPMLPVKFVQR